MLNKTIKKTLHLFWLQNFDLALQYCRLDSSIYEPLAEMFSLSCYQKLKSYYHKECKKRPKKHKKEKTQETFKKKSSIL